MNALTLFGSLLLFVPIDDIWVDKENALPTGTGSESNPFQRISQALDAAAANDVVKVKKGL